MAFRIFEILRSRRMLNPNHILSDNTISEYEKIRGLDDETGHREERTTVTYRLAECGCTVDEIAGLCRCGAVLCKEPSHSYFCKHTAQRVCFRCCNSRGEEDSVLCAACSIRAGIRNVIGLIRGRNNRALPR